MIRLECTRGGSNKFYELSLAKTKGRVTVTGYYGAIGQAPKTHPIYDGDNEQEAKAEMQRKQLEKQKKGYIIVGNGQAPISAAEKKNGELPIIWPMNAQGVRGKEHLEQLLMDDSYIAQEKLDGMRTIVHFTKDGLRIFSRSAGVGDPTRPIEKTDSLPHLAALRFPGFVGTILDCEILAPGLDAAQLAGSVHRKNGVNGEHEVKLFAFDILSFCSTNLLNRKLLERLNWLHSLKYQLNTDSIQFLPWTRSSAEKRALYESILSNGGEGIILKHLDEFYIQGARPSQNWIKVKKSMTIDAVVMGFTKGKGKFNDSIGAVVFGQYVKTSSGWKLQELGRASGMSVAVRNEMSANPRKFIGCAAVISGMERLRSGAIRHPIFVSMRYDKHPHQCCWYQGEQ